MMHDVGLIINIRKEYNCKINFILFFLITVSTYMHTSNTDKNRGGHNCCADRIP